MSRKLSEEKTGEAERVTESGFTERAFILGLILIILILMFSFSFTLSGVLTFLL